MSQKPSPIPFSRPWTTPVPHLQEREAWPGSKIPWGNPYLPQDHLSKRPDYRPHITRPPWSAPSADATGHRCHSWGLGLGPERKDESTRAPSTARTQDSALRVLSSHTPLFAAEVGGIADTILVQVTGQRQQVGPLQVHHQPLELYLAPTRTVLELKQVIEQAVSVPIDRQRLFVKSCRLLDTKELRECGGQNGRLDVVLIPALTHRHAGATQPISSRRGFHMVSGNEQWRPHRSSAIRHKDLNEFFGQPAGKDAQGPTLSKLMDEDMEFMSAGFPPNRFDSSRATTPMALQY